MLILFWLTQTWLVTLRIQEYAFSGCTLSPDSKETKLGSSDEASPSAGKKYRGSFSAMSRMEVCPYSYFWWYGYLRGPGLSFVKTDKFSVGVTIFFFKNWCLMNSLPTFLFLTFLTQWTMAILSKGCKPDIFESHNSLKLNFTNIPDLRSNFVECESFLEHILLTFWLYVRQNWMTQLILAISMWGVIFL